MIKLSFFSLFIFISFSLTAQSVSPSALKKIEGKWEGQLTYTDYQDDSSQSTLNCKMEAKWKNKKGVLTFIFVEPDGRIIKDKTKIKLKKKGTQLVFDGQYQVLDFSPDKMSESWKLTIGTTGKDNNRNAEIKRVINCSKTQFTITKLVKYAGTAHFFERNQYAFERKN